MKKELINNKKLECKEISAYPNYFININGEVFKSKGLKKLVKLTPVKRRKSYYVNLGKNGKFSNVSVALLVVKTFLGTHFDGLKIIYLDKNKSNHKLTNLYYGYNRHYSYEKEYSKDELLNLKIKHKEVPDYDGYIVNENGEFFSCLSDRYNKKIWKKLCLSLTDGRPYVTLCTNKTQVHFIAHQIVARTFLGVKPKGLHCCHNNGNGADNRVVNLRYDTPKNNNADKIKHGTHQCGEKHGRHKLKNEQVIEIKRMLKTKQYTQIYIATLFNISFYTISLIKKNKIWKHIN